MKFSLSFLLALGLFLPFISMTLGVPLDSVSSGINKSNNNDKLADGHQLDLPEATIRELDKLFQEIRPIYANGVIDFSNIRYAELITHLLDGSYVGPIDHPELDPSHPNYIEPVHHEVPTEDAGGHIPTPSGAESNPGNITASDHEKIDLYHYPPTCETSGASPLTREAREFLSIIRKAWRHQYCNQGNLSGSHCTTLGKHKGVKFGICGNHTNGALHCKMVFEYWQNLIDRCLGRREGQLRIGGYKRFDMHWRGKVDEERVQIF